MKNLKKVNMYICFLFIIFSFNLSVFAEESSLINDPIFKKCETVPQKDFFNIEYNKYTGENNFENTNKKQDEKIRLLNKEFLWNKGILVLEDSTKYFITLTDTHWKFYVQDQSWKKTKYYKDIKNQYTDQYKEMVKSQSAENLSDSLSDWFSYIWDMFEVEPYGLNDKRVLGLVWNKPLFIAIKDNNSEVLVIDWKESKEYKNISFPWYSWFMENWMFNAKTVDGKNIILLLNSNWEIKEVWDFKDDTFFDFSFVRWDLNKTYIFAFSNNYSNENGVSIMIDMNGVIYDNMKYIYNNDYNPSILIKDNKPIFFGVNRKDELTMISWNTVKSLPWISVKSIEYVYNVWNTTLVVIWRTDWKHQVVFNMKADTETFDTIIHKVGFSVQYPQVSQDGKKYMYVWNNETIYNEKNSDTWSPPLKQWSSSIVINWKVENKIDTDDNNPLFINTLFYNNEPFYTTFWKDRKTKVILWSDNSKKSYYDIKYTQSILGWFQWQIVWRDKNIIDVLSWPSLKIIQSYKIPDLHSFWFIWDLDKENSALEVSTQSWKFVYFNDEKSLAYKDISNVKFLFENKQLTGKMSAIINKNYYICDINHLLYQYPTLTQKDKKLLDEYVKKLSLRIHNKEKWSEYFILTLAQYSEKFDKWTRKYDIISYIFNKLTSNIFY